MRHNGALTYSSRRLGVSATMLARVRTSAPAMAFAFVTLLMLVCPAAHAVELAVRDDGTTAGYVTLSWESDGGTAVELQQRQPDGNWRTVYQGMDTASTLSGLDDGVYSFRAREVPSPQNASRAGWSEPLSVTIAHHPLSRALGFFAVGAVMFTVLLLCIAAPSRDRGTRP